MNYSSSDNGLCKGGQGYAPMALFSSAVAAGFPSPAESYVEKTLDLNEHLVRHPAATFFVRVAGNSMTDAGIQDGDILVVDRSLEAYDGSVVVAVLAGEFTVKKIRIREGSVQLVPANSGYAVTTVREDSPFYVWGVVTAAIHRFGERQ